MNCSFSKDIVQNCNVGCIQIWITCVIYETISFEKDQFIASIKSKRLAKLNKPMFYFMLFMKLPEKLYDFVDKFEIEYINNEINVS